MKTVVIKFNVEMDGEVLAKIAKCLKEHEPEIFSIMHDQLKPAFDKFLNGETVSEAEARSERN